MNELILKDNGFSILSKSICDELEILHDAEFHLHEEGFGTDDEDEHDYFMDGGYIFQIEVSERGINKMVRQVNSLIKNGCLNDVIYHNDVAKLYGILTDDSVKHLQQVKSFYNLYNNHYKKVVKAYHKSLLLEAIWVIKDNTPIVNDNICDILSFLNDEKYFSKHQIDDEIYEIM